MLHAHKLKYFPPKVGFYDWIFKKLLKSKHFMQMSKSPLSVVPFLWVEYIYS